MTLFPSFAVMLDKIKTRMRTSSLDVHTESWQGIDISKRPEAKMRELLGVYFEVPMDVCDKPDGLQLLREELKPNLPWADDHFKERVCGYPMNPGETWKRWPWAHSAGNFLDEKGRFEVNYMERFWAAKRFSDTPEPGKTSFLTGIRGRTYGDLSDIIELLGREPHTRQAYMPIYFPEDTGAGGRVPCSLGYHWIMRSNYLHVHYPIRSCDFFRHFVDDVYLAVRLTMWLRDELAKETPDAWEGVKLGKFSMWIGSMHIFINDFYQLFGALDGKR